MRIHVDYDRCTGHARCAAVASDLFELDDLGFSAHRGRTIEVPADREAEARKGVAACPELAISIEAGS